MAGSPDWMGGDSLSKSMNAFELITMCGGLDLTPMFDKDAQHVKKFTRFHTVVPPLQAIARIGEVLSEQGIEHKVMQTNFKVKVNHSTDKGQLTCTVQIFSIAPGLHLVDWRRGQGDLMSYYKFYKDVREKLGDLIANKDG